MHEIFLAPIELPNHAFIKRVREELLSLFHCNVHTLRLSLDLASSYSSERNQYHSTSLIAQAAEQTAQIEGKIILLLQSDLFVPVLTYVFGEAQLNGKLSIVSLCRLHEEFYTGISDEELLLQRTLKEILHELGHNYGLLHCKNWDCVMHSSTGIEEVDIKGSTFCSSCITSIQIIKY